MNRNHLKIIACISMLIDHVGYVLFPDIAFLRVIGRVAMPIFAFFIGEGCIYTKDRKKYFLRLFVLALICQAVNIAESIITDSGNGLYLNILFTFSFSIVLCSCFISFKENSSVKNMAVLIFCVAAFYSMNEFFNASYGLIGEKITLDYNFPGICLPVFAAVSKDRRIKFPVYAAGLVGFSYVTYGGFNELFLFALLSLVPLYFYNGEGGKMNLKYFFYLFYPLHLAAIYLVNILTSVL